MSNPVGAARVTIEADAGPAADSIVDLMDAALDRVVRVAGDAFTQVERAAATAATGSGRSANAMADAYQSAVTQVERSAGGIDTAFQRAGNRAEQSASGVAGEWQQAGTRAEASASGIGSAYNAEGSTAEAAATQVASAWRQTGTRAESAANGVGGAWQQAGSEGEEAAVGLANAYQRAIEGMSSAGEGAGESSGGSFIAAFGTRISALATRAGPIGMALAAVVGVGTFAGAQIADKVFEGFQIQAERDFAQASFGFNDAQMAQAGQAAGDAYGNAWGASVQDNINTVGIAIQSGLLDGNATAAQMQPVIEQLSFVSSIMGEEIPAVARAAGQMIKTNMVDTPTQAFDLLTAAQQRGLNLSEDVLDTVTEYGTQFRKVGISGQQAFGLIAQAVAGGARDTDIAADAVKEFSLRVIDDSELTKGAFETLSESIGMSADEIEAEFGKGGAAANSMADKVFGALGKIEDPIKRNEVAIALFGTQIEDLGGAFGKMNLSTAAAEFDATGKAIDGMNVAGGGAAASIEAAKNKITVAADEMKVKLAEAFAPTALDASAWVTEHQDQIVLFFANAAKAAIDFTAAVLDGAGGFMQFASVSVDATTHVLKYALWPFVKAMEKMGELMSHLPGNAGEMGESIRDNARQFDGMMTSLTQVGGGMRDTGDAMFTLADKIRDGSVTLDDFIAAQNASMQANDEQTAKTYALVDALNTLPREKPIDVTTPGGQTALQLFTNMGIEVTRNNDKTISVNAPLAPPVLETLKQLGIEVVNNNGKNIVVASNAPAVKTDVDHLNESLNAMPTQKSIDVIYNMMTTGQAPNMGVDSQGNVVPRVHMPFTTDGSGPGGRADGGPIRGPGGPRDDKVPLWGSNGEFMMQAAAVDMYGLDFMHDVNAGKYADGGVIGAAASSAASSIGNTFGGGSTFPELAQIVMLLQQIAMNTATGVTGGPVGGAAAEVGATAPAADFGAAAATGAAGVANGWQASADGLTAIKEGQIDPALTALQQQVVDYGANTQTQLATVVDPAWAASASNLALTKSSVIDPTLAGLDASTANTALATQNAVFAGINPAWQAMGGNVMAVKTGTVDPALAGMQGAVWNTANAFGAGAASIATQWNQVREATAAPVRFAIGAVFNDGIVGMWNSVSDLLGTQKMGTYPIRFASGGIVPGAGAEDKIPALVMPKEFVVPRGMAAAIGGGNLDRGLQMLDSVRQRGPTAGLGAEGLFSGIAGRYAAGGVVQGTPAWEAMKRGHAFAARWNGAPYVWGGSLGPDGGTDCSGYMSSIADVILGGSGLQRQWATGSFPGGGGTQGAGGPQGFVQGLGAGMSIGVSVEHTAGTLGGIDGLPTVNIESGGSHGNVAYGGPAVGADNSQFPSQYHLPIVAGAFMSGGGGGGSTMSMQDIVGGITGPAWDKIMSTAGSWTGGGLIGSYPSKLAEKMKGATTAKIDKLVQEMSTFADPGGAGVERWRPLVTLLLKRYSLGEENADRTLRRMNQESSGNPRAINLDDSNAKAGTPSKGLMQVIDPTFATHRDPALSADIWDPMANVGASMRYAMAQYGSLAAAYDKAGGYDRGGLAKGTGIMLKDVISPERVLDPQMTPLFDKFMSGLKMSGSGSVSFGGLTVTGSGEMRIDGDRVAAGFSGVTSEGKRVEIRVTNHQYFNGDDPRRLANEMNDHLLSLVP